MTLAAIGGGRGEGMLLVRNKEGVWPWIPCHLNVSYVLVASVVKCSYSTPHNEAHDISSVLEVTEDRSLWDSRASAGIVTPFAMLT